LVYTYTIYIALNCRYTLYTEVVHTNYLISSLNIYISKTLVFNFSALSGYLSIDGKLYYNSGLFLNESIDSTSISL
jgi:hypothetical protein